MVNKHKLFFLLIFICIAVFIAFVSSEIIVNNTSNENKTLNNSFGILDNSINSSKSHGGGGSAVPVSNINLSDQKGNYNMKPGRLKFNFEGNVYAIQVRRVKENYVDFLILRLDGVNKEEDVTAYKLDNSFSLNLNQENKIDLNKDGILDISIELNDISLAGESGNIKSADFSVEKIK
jgi:hypothetical protein